MADWSDHAWKLLIGGELVDGANGTSPIVNPATEEVVGLAPESSVDQALDAARAAQEAFPAWAATPVAERAALLRAVTDQLMKLQADLVPLIIAETGATATVGSRMQVPVAIERFERYARDAGKSLGIALPPSPVASTPLAPGALMGAYVNRQPVGAVACISPYNFPLTNIAGKIAPALAVGCTVVVKPAPQDPLAILVLGEIMREVGFPPGVVNVVTSADVAPAVALTETRDIDMVSFTGSTVAGQAIYQAGGATMKRMLLELGGKGAAVVFDDADIDLAVTAIGSVYAFHSGQICTAPTRAVVHRSRYQELVDRLAAMAGALPVGDPLSEDTIVGPLISAAQRDRVEAYVGAGADEGAEVVVDGRKPANLDRGFYVAPTLLASCTADMKPVREEIFGPVVVVVPFDDDDEAVAIANSTDFGLYDYVFTGDSEKGFRTAGRLRSGNVGINTAQRNMEAPFGGFKMSGIGRDGGDFGLLAYTEMQSVMWPDERINMTKPPMLDGIRVIECSLLGPAAITSHLVDFGAEVIKVEAPSGDYVRQMTWPMVNDISLMHLHLNRGKQSLVLDLKVPEAIQVFEELVRQSHVVIEAMRPGFLEKRGLGYARLRELNPAIVMCTISGYGATGPYRDLPSHGIAYDAWAGTLQPVVDDEGFVRIPDQANIGITAGPAFGAIGILATLVRAEKTGEGTNMEIAQSDAAAYFDWYRIETWKGYDERPDTEVTGNPSDDYERRAPGLGGMWEGVRYQYYEAADGHVLFMASEQAFWKNFCEGIDRMDLFEKWPGKRIADHARGNTELQAELRDIFNTRTIESEWIAFADEHNTTIAPANTPQTVRDDPQFRDRFRWTTAEQTGADELLFPLHVEGEELPIPTMAPTVGEHTDEVLTRVLGYDADRLAKLKASGALG